MIKAIVAMDAKQTIGKNNALPWRNKEDLQHFRTTTLNQAIVMGRKTFESLKKALPNRSNIVLTTQKDYLVPPDVQIIHDVQQLVETYQNSEEVLYVIGGAQIYQLFLPYCQELVISLIPGSHEGDTFFPDFSSQFILRKIEEKVTFSVHYYERCNEKC